MTPGADSRDWLKPFIILAILGLIVCNPAFQLSWVGNIQVSNTFTSSQNDVSYEVTGRFAGSPSIVLPFGDYLIVAIADQLELRNSTYGLISSIQLPYFVTEAVLTDGGDVIVPIPNQGLILVDIDEEMNLNILDYYESGSWTGLKCGYDFFLASRSDSEALFLFDVSDEEIVLERIIDPHFSDSRYRPYSAEGHLFVWTSGYEFHLWNHSQGIEQVFRDECKEIEPLYVCLEGGVLTWWGFPNFGEGYIETVIADIGSVWSTNEVEILQWYPRLLGWPIASSSEFIYLFGYVSWSSDPISLLAVNLTEYSDFYVIDDRFPWSTNILPPTAADGSGVVLTGLNFFEWWIFHGLESEVKLRVEYSGYITDLTSAFGIFDNAVLPAYDFDRPPARRTWGYPFVNPDLFPIVGDLTDVKAAYGHLFYQNQSVVQSLLEPRMIYYLQGLDPAGYLPHPSAELFEYDDVLYGSIYFYSDGYRLCKLDPTKHYDSVSEVLGTEVLNHLSGWRGSFYISTMQDDVFMAGDPSHLFAMNVTSLEHGVSEVSLYSDIKMLQGYEDKLLVLGGGITCYEKNSSWPLTPSIIYLSEIDIDADVFAVSNDLIYAANSTHMHIISLGADGAMNLIDTIEVPTNIHQRTEYVDAPWDIIFLEVGDLLVNSVSGTIYRAAGTYGIWVIERIEHTEPPTTTTTTTTTSTTTTTTIESMDFLEAVVRFSAGFGISLVSVLALSLVVRRFGRYSHE